MNYQDIFKDAYQKKVGIPFLQWSGKEGKCLKELYALLPVFWKEFKQIEINEPQQLQAFEHFLESIDDDFVLASFTPSVILACFNSLAQQAYGKHKKPNVIRFTFDLPTDEEIKEIQQIKKGYKRLKNEQSKPN